MQGEELTTTVFVKRRNFHDIAGRPCQEFPFRLPESVLCVCERTSNDADEIRAWKCIICTLTHVVIVGETKRVTFRRGLTVDRSLHGICEFDVSTVPCRSLHLQSNVITKQRKPPNTFWCKPPNSKSISTVLLYSKVAFG